MDNPLILAFGMPRSGTTWVGKILDSSPQVLYCHEPDSWLKLSSIPLYSEPALDAQQETFLEKYISDLPNLRLPQVTTKRPLFNKQYSSPVRRTAHKGSVVLSNIVNRVNTAWNLPTISNIGREKRNIHVVWKSIESLGRMGTIVRHVPDCRTIHIIRHPCGYIASVITGEQSRRFVSTAQSSEDYGIFEQLLSSSTGQSYGLTLGDLKRLHPVQRLAWRWLITNEKAFSDLEGMKNNYVLCYEDLCENPEQESRKIYHHLGLDWSDQTESFVINSTRTNSKGYYSVFKNPKDAAYKWRSILTRSEQQLVYDIIAISQRARQLYSE